MTRQVLTDLGREPWQVHPEPPGANSCESRCSCKQYLHCLSMCPHDSFIVPTIANNDPRLCRIPLNLQVRNDRIWTGECYGKSKICTRVH
jgi:hypothetical protein